MNTLPCETTNEIDSAIINLERSSEALDLWADHPRNYNSDMAHILSMISLEMRNQISTLREASYLYGRF